MYCRMIREREHDAWYRVHTRYKATMRVVIRYVRHFWLYLLGSPDVIVSLGQGYAR